METTLREVITHRELNPIVRRDNGSSVGDDWRRFFAASELDTPIEREYHSRHTDWWRAGNTVLIDNFDQSVLAVV